ncbi:MAG: alpha/beta hydrolase, partial [Thiobacillaceae bacterium]|nr:alpha/beta hydrolase [Thiobacillaceae bacterium]
MSATAQAAVAARAERRLIPRADGGVVETMIEAPAGPPRGLALIAHPHPLHGGNMNHKVVVMLARAVLDCGWLAVRANFRGVGASTGAFDHGRGEVEDLLAVVHALAADHPHLPWVLAGFSFGAYVQHRLAARIRPTRLILVAPPVDRYAFAAPTAPTEIVHGTEDELIAPAQVAAYAERHGL